MSQLPDGFRGHFFLCDFRGGGTGSGVHSFALKSKGAAFEVVDKTQFVWGLLAQRLGLTATLSISAGLLMIAAWSVRVLPLRSRSTERG